MPAALIQRLTHYFTTYKLGPDEKHEVRVGAPYDRKHAEAVVSAAQADYRAEFGITQPG